MDLASELCAKCLTKHTACIISLNESRIGRMFSWPKVKQKNGEQQEDLDFLHSDESTGSLDEGLSSSSSRLVGGGKWRCE